MFTRIDEILKKSKDGQGINEEEALTLLKEIRPDSEKFTRLLYIADQQSKDFFNGVGEVHGQIGLNQDKCSKNCKFCNFANDNFKEQASQLSDSEILRRLEELLDAGIGSLSLMTTADFPFDEYVRIGQMIIDKTKGQVLLFGNWGDITLEQAKVLKKVGFTFYYHALRLREGIDTEIRRGKRIESMRNVKKAGLLLGSCLEPIGPEHTYEEIVDLLEEMKNLDIRFMATMKRIVTPNSLYEMQEEITDLEFAKITAVTRLYFGKRLLTMAAHEPSGLCLNAGANFLVAESGTNPRDGERETSNNRGLSVVECQKLLSENGYKVFRGDFLERYNGMV